MSSIHNVSSQAEALRNLLSRALACHQRSAFSDAELLYRQILNVRPDHPEANHYMGLLACQGGRPDAGLAYLKQAAEAKPAHGPYALTYAEALLELGQATEAKRALQVAIRYGLGMKHVRPLLQRIEAALGHGRDAGRSTIEQSRSGRQLPVAEQNHLLGLFHSARFAELELAATTLAKQYSDTGFVWNMLGIARGILGKDALHALQQAARCLPDDPAVHSNLGYAQVKAGCFAEAEASCRRALHLNPDSVDALVNLGLALRGLGRFEAAAESYRKALKLRPEDPEIYSNLGNSQRDLGRFDEAVALYQRALLIRPDTPGALNNLGCTLQVSGRLEESVETLRKALALNPADAEVHHNLGLSLMKLGQLEAALEEFQHALRLVPDFLDAHISLGNTLKEGGAVDAALVSYNRALAIDPDFAEAHNNLALALAKLGRYEGAVAGYRRAIELKPEYAEALSNQSTALKELGRLDEALICCRRALDIKPDLAEAHNNYGLVLAACGELTAASRAYQQVLEMKPDYAEASNNLGLVLKDLGHLDEAVGCYLRALEIKPDYTQVLSNLLFTRNYQEQFLPAALLSEARQFNDIVVKKLPHIYTAWANVIDQDRPLRIGFVSGDLRAHPVGFFAESVLSALATTAAERMQMTVYANQSCFDATSERIKSCCSAWHAVSHWADDVLIRKIREDGIDILVDLSGHSGANRLSVFAAKPAPVQVTWLGYFATTGLSSIDYLIADPWTLPPTEEIYFSEKIWRLPETRLCFTAPDVNVEVSALPALRNGYLTFGCFNNLTKLNDSVCREWARVLKAVPASRLFLKAKQLDEMKVRQDITTRFVSHGVDAERLILEGHSPRQEYFAAYQRVDVALDPFPFTGGTTSAESLWMGVPVLTLAGERFLSRQGVGLLANAGLTDWIAESADAYVELAVLHSSNLPRLAELRAGLRQQVLASPIFDALRFASFFDQALRAMWVEWCRKSEASQ